VRLPGLKKKGLKDGLTDKLVPKEKEECRRKEKSKGKDGKSGLFLNQTPDKL